MRLGIISDIHSNILAFKECVKKLEAERCDEYLFLGDFVSDTPYTRETMDYLYEFIDTHTCRLLRGNREEYMLSQRKVLREGPEDQKWIYNSASGNLLYSYELLTMKDLDFFESLPISFTYEKEGYPAIKCCPVHNLRCKSTTFSQHRFIIRKDFVYLPTEIILNQKLFTMKTSKQLFSLFIAIMAIVGIMSCGSKTDFERFKSLSEESLSLKEEMNSSDSNIDFEEWAPKWEEIYKQMEDLKLSVLKEVSSDSLKGKEFGDPHIQEGYNVAKGMYYTCKLYVLIKDFDNNFQTWTKDEIEENMNAINQLCTQAGSEKDIIPQEEWSYIEFLFEKYSKMVIGLTIMSSDY